MQAIWTSGELNREYTPVNDYITIPISGTEIPSDAVCSDVSIEFMRHSTDGEDHSECATLKIDGDIDIAIISLWWCDDDSDSDSDTSRDYPNSNYSGVTDGNLKNKNSLYSFVKGKSGIDLIIYGKCNIYISYINLTFDYKREKWGKFVANDNLVYDDGQTILRTYIEFPDNPTVYYSDSMELTDSNYASGTTTPYTTSNLRYDFGGTIYWYAKETEDYTSLCGSVDVTSKISKGTATFTAHNVSTSGVPAEGYVTIGTFGTIYYGEDENSMTNHSDANLSVDSTYVVVTQETVGSSTVYCQLRPFYTDRYNDSEIKTVTATVTYMKPEGSVATVPELINDEVAYNSCENIITAGEGTGTMMYYLYPRSSEVPNDDDFTTEIPKATSQYQVGLYTISYYSAESDGYKASSKDYIDFEIIKATPTYTSVPGTSVEGTTAVGILIINGISGIIHYGDSQSDMNETHTIPTDNSYTFNIVTRTELGISTVYWYFVPTDTTNYNNIGSSDSPKSITATVNSDKTAGSVTTAPESKDVKYGSGDYLFTAGLGTGEMMYGLTTDNSNDSSSVTFKNSITKENKTYDAGSQLFLWYYAAESDAYAASDKSSITVNINKATPKLTGTNNTVNAGNTAACVVSVDVPGTIYYGNSESSMTSSKAVTESMCNTGIILATNSTNGTTLTEYVYFVPTYTTNYETLGSSSVPYLTVKATVKEIEKQENTVSTKPVNKSVIYNSNNTVASAPVFKDTTATIKYALSSSSVSSPSTYSATMPTASSSINAGTYYLWYYAEATTNYNATTPKYVTVTISKAACVNTFDINGYTDTYDGSSHTVTITGTDGLIYEYMSYSSPVSTDSESWPTQPGTFTDNGTTKPTRINAGITWVKARIAATTNYKASDYCAAVKIQIDKKDPEFTFTDCENVTYNGSVQTLGTVKSSSSVCYYKVSSSSSALTGTETEVGPVEKGDEYSWGATNVGTYYLWVKTEEGTNYKGNDYTYKKSNTICKKSVSFTAPTKVSGTFKYTGYSQVIFNAGSCDTGGKIYYMISSSKPDKDASGWSVTCPISGTSVGDYNLYYKYTIDDNNYSGSGVNTVKGPVTASIAKGDQDISVINPDSQEHKTRDVLTFKLGVSRLGDGTITYPSSITVNDSSVSGWTISGSEITVPAGTASGIYTVTGTVSVAASGNYNSGSKKLTWKIIITSSTIDIDILTGTTKMRDFPDIYNTNNDRLVEMIYNLENKILVAKNDYENQINIMRNIINSLESKLNEYIDSDE